MYRVLASLLLLLHFLCHHRVESHGYVFSPQSRSYLCRVRWNANCGPVMWEPQSVEGCRGFPIGGPKDGELANGGSTRFRALNEYGIGRWNVSYMQFDSFNETHAIVNFDWRITASHSTKSFRVFLTNANYRDSMPVSRKLLFLKPICEDKFDGKRPLIPRYRQTCIVLKYLLGINVGLARGFYAVWDIADNYNSFYQWIDFKTKFPLFNNDDHDNGDDDVPMTTAAAAVTTRKPSANDAYIHIRKDELISVLKLSKKILTPFLPLLRFL